jgi:hypothetical protein
VTPTEIAWHKSSLCRSTMCVEVGRDGDYHLVRDSKNPGRPALRFGRKEWIAFLGRIQYGDLAVM